MVNNPFKLIHAKASFERGQMTLSDSRIESNAFNGRARGTVDLVNQTLDVKAEIQTLATLDKALDLIPLVGRASSALTNIYVDVKGPLQSPRITPTPTKRVTSPLKELFRFPRK